MAFDNPHMNVAQLERLLAGELLAVCVEPDGRLHTSTQQAKLLLPGSFNPLHEGHRELLALSAQLLGRSPAFELSVTNVDKPTLSVEEVRRRIDQFAGLAPVWLSRAARFVEKARLFPGAVFVVGADTALRIVDERYYAEGANGLRAALAELRQRGCRFLVGGRITGNEFLTLDKLPIPSDYRELFEAIPETLFRRDISSTWLRQQQG
jgi:hypothetical protein